LLGRVFLSKDGPVENPVATICTLFSRLVSLARPAPTPGVQASGAASPECQVPSLLLSGVLIADQLAEALTGTPKSPEAIRRAT
jgi:hypothetical protein